MEKETNRTWKPSGLRTLWVYTASGDWFQPKNIGQIGSFLQVGAKMQNIWNYQACLVNTFPDGKFASVPSVDFF